MQAQAAGLERNGGAGTECRDASDAGIQRQRWRQRPGLIREGLGIRPLINRTPRHTSGRHGPALAAFVERPQSGCDQIGAVD